MPTGYTVMIEEDGNTNAREFVAKCARAFGMFAHQREDSLDAELVYPELDAYYSRALDHAKIALNAAEDWTEEEIAANHRKHVNDMLDSNDKSVRRAKQTNDRYEAVLAKLVKWQPTDEINQNVKQYAIDQINMCYPVASYTVLPEIDQDVWYQGRLTHLREQVAYYSERVEEEKARLAGRKVAIDNFLAELGNIPE